VGSAFKNCKAAIRTSADFTNYQATTDVARGEGIVSSLALPLIIRNRTLGALGLGSRTENAFSQEDVDFLMRVAGQVAIAVEKALALEVAALDSAAAPLSEAQAKRRTAARAELAMNASTRIAVSDRILNSAVI